jgi:hypothetical protein
MHNCFDRANVTRLAIPLSTSGSCWPLARRECFATKAVVWPVRVARRVSHEPATLPRTRASLLLVEGDNVSVRPHRSLGCTCRAPGPITLTASSPAGAGVDHVDLVAVELERRRPRRALQRPDRRRAPVRSEAAARSVAMLAAARRARGASRHLLRPTFRAGGGLHRPRWDARYR